MRIRRILCVALLPLALALTGCESFQKAPGATFDRVTQEMRQAQASLPKNTNDALSQAMLPPLQLDAPEPQAKRAEPRFDLAVSNAPAAQVFMALVAGTRYSMLVPPEVSGTVTLNLKNVTVREVLEAVRELYGYEFRYQGTRIYIQPNTLQTRIFQINYLAGKREGQSDVRVTSGSISTGQQNTNPGQAAQSVPVGGNNTSYSLPSSQIQTTQNSDFWRDLSTALTSIVGNQEGRSVIVNPASGVVMVKAFSRSRSGPSKTTCA